MAGLGRNITSARIDHEVRGQLASWRVLHLMVYAQLGAGGRAQLPVQREEAALLVEVVGERRGVTAEH